MADGTLQPPSIKFDGTKINDKGSIPIVYRFDNANGLIECGSDVDAELAAMLQASSRNTAVGVTLNPLYIAPSRTRYRLSENGERGTAKEYAVLTVSLTQSQPLPVLNGKRLSWSSSWSLVNGTQDVPDAALSAPDGDDTLELMNLVDGVAVLGVEFTTGTAGGSGLTRIFAAAKTIAGTGIVKSSLPAASLDAATSALSDLGSLISQFGRGQSFDIDIAAGGGIRVAAHSLVPNATLTGVLRLPKAPTRFLFTPSHDQAAFKAALAQIDAANQKVALDPDDGQPLVVDKHTGVPIASTSLNRPRGALSDFTIVIIEASVLPTEA